MLGFAFGWLFAGGTTAAPAARASRRRLVPTVVWINNTPVQLAGVRVQRLAGVLNGTARATPQASRVGGFTGGRYAPLVPTQPREIELTGVLLNVPLEQQRAALDAWFLLCTGELELRFPHAPTQVIRGVAGTPQVEPLDPEKAYVLDAAGCVPLRVTTTIVCADGVAYEQHPHRLRLSTTPTPVPLGSGTVHGRLLLQGPHEGALDVDLLSPGGALLQRLALRDAPGAPVVLADGDVCTAWLSAPFQLVRRTAAGVTTNVLAWRSLEASTPTFLASPWDADPARGQYPLVRLSAGTGWWTFARASAH